MPEELHEKLKRTARKKGLKGKRRRAYIHGTLKRVEKKLKKAFKK